MLSDLGRWFLSDRRYAMQTDRKEQAGASDIVKRCHEMGLECQGPSLRYLCQITPGVILLTDVIHGASARFAHESHETHGESSR